LLTRKKEPVSRRRGVARFRCGKSSPLSPMRRTVGRVLQLGRRRRRCFEGRKGWGKCRNGPRTGPTWAQWNTEMNVNTKRKTEWVVRSNTQMKRSRRSRGRRRSRRKHMLTVVRAVPDLRMDMQEMQGWCVCRFERGEETATKMKMKMSMARELAGTVAPLVLGDRESRGRDGALGGRIPAGLSWKKRMTMSTATVRTGCMVALLAVADDDYALVVVVLLGISLCISY